MPSQDRDLLAWDRKKKATWTQNYSSFSLEGPYPKLNRDSTDRSPLKSRCVVSKTGLVGLPDRVPAYPIGMCLNRVPSDFGVEVFDDGGDR